MSIAVWDVMMWIDGRKVPHLGNPYTRAKAHEVAHAANRHEARVWIEHHYNSRQRIYESAQEQEHQRKQRGGSHAINSRA